MNNLQRYCNNSEDVGKCTVFKKKNLKKDIHQDSVQVCSNHFSNIRELFKIHPQVVC